MSAKLDSSTHLHLRVSPSIFYTEIWQPVAIRIIGRLTLADVSAMFCPFERWFHMRLAGCRYKGGRSPGLGKARGPH